MGLKTAFKGPSDNTYSYDTMKNIKALGELNKPIKD